MLVLSLIACPLRGSDPGNACLSVPDLDPKGKPASFASDLLRLIWAICVVTHLPIDLGKAHYI